LYGSVKALYERADLPAKMVRGRAVFVQRLAQQIQEMHSKNGLKPGSLCSEGQEVQQPSGKRVYRCITSRKWSGVMATQL